MTSDVALADQLADRISELLDDQPIDVAATALTVNLAAVIAGYGARGRDAAETSIVALLRTRIAQLVEAGLDTSN